MGFLGESFAGGCIKGEPVGLGLALACGESVVSTNDGRQLRPVLPGPIAFVFAFM